MSGQPNSLADDEGAERRVVHSGYDSSTTDHAARARGHVAQRRLVLVVAGDDDVRRVVVRAAMSIQHCKGGRGERVSRPICILLQLGLATSCITGHVDIDVMTMWPGSRLSFSGSGSIRNSDRGSIRRNIKEFCQHNQWSTP
jgi:hypothetical protein